MSLHSKGEADSCLQVDDLDLHRKRNGEYILNASIHCEHSSLKAKGALNFDYLKSIFESLPPKASRFELSEVMDRVLGSVEELRAILRQTGSLHLKSFLRLSDGELGVCQSDEENRDC